jgi:hypothetical protein
VFTVPHELNVLALENFGLFYDLLFTASAQTLLEIAIDRKHLGAKIGVISILHLGTKPASTSPHSQEQTCNRRGLNFELTTRLSARKLKTEPTPGTHYLRIAVVIGPGIGVQVPRVTALPRTGLDP